MTKNEFLKQLENALKYLPQDEIEERISFYSEMIDDYIAGIQFTSAQLGKIKEVITIFGLKSIHGLYEAQAPVQVKNNDKSVANIGPLKINRYGLPTMSFRNIQLNDYKGTNL